MFRTLHVSLVRPHLEYASQIWNPRDTRALEKVQRRATRLVPELKYLSYGDRLSALNLPSLLYRRRIDMITVFKLTDWREYHLKHYSLFTTQSLEVMGTNYIRNLII